MINLRALSISAIMVFFTYNISFSMQNPDIVDIRTFGLEFPQNKQDGLGNTFWHNLALASETFVDWSEVNQRMNEFKQNNKNWLPNPFVLNNNGKTARQVAEDVFNQSGNPISGLLAFVFLKQQEDNFLNKMALKISRDMNAQQMASEYPING